MKNIIILLLVGALAASWFYFKGEVQRVDIDVRLEMESSVEERAAALYFDYLKKPEKGVLLKQKFEKSKYDPNRVRVKNESGYHAWVAEVVSQVFSFGFNDYDERMEDVRPYFEPKAYDGFIQVLGKLSFSKEDVERKAAVFSSVPMGVPVRVSLLKVHSDGSVEPKQLIYKMPIIISAESFSKKESMKLHVTVVLNVEDPQNIKIMQLVVH